LLVLELHLIQIIMPPLLYCLFPYTTLFRSHIMEFLYAIPGMEDVEDVIVSSGPNTWPNWRNFSDRIIRPGEIVFMDLAALTWNRSEEHTSELQSRSELVCRLLHEKKNINPL